MHQSSAYYRFLITIFVAEKRFKNRGISVYSLSDYEHLIELATENRYILKREEENVAEMAFGTQNGNPNNMEISSSIVRVDHSTEQLFLNCQLLKPMKT